MENLKKSPMVKNGEIVSNTLTETTKKVAKRNNRGSYNKTLTVVNNSNLVLDVTTDALLNENERHQSEMSEIYFDFEKAIGQFEEASQQYESRIEANKKRLCHSTQKFLKLNIPYVGQNSNEMERKSSKETVGFLINCLKKMLDDYRLKEDPEEYLSFIRSIKPETLVKIQHYGDVKQQ